MPGHLKLQVCVHVKLRLTWAGRLPRAVGDQKDSGHHGADVPLQAGRWCLCPLSFDKGACSYRARRVGSHRMPQLPAPCLVWNACLEH